MLLNKRKRNPGQNLTKNWVRVNNVCEPAPKTMFCPPPPPPPVPEGFNEHRKCVSIWQIDNGFLTGQSLRLLKSGYTVRAKQFSALPHRPT